MDPKFKISFVDNKIEIEVLNEAAISFRRIFSNIYPNGSNPLFYAFISYFPRISEFNFEKNNIIIYVEIDFNEIDSTLKEIK